MKKYKIQSNIKQTIGIKGVEIKYQAIVEITQEVYDILIKGYKTGIIVIQEIESQEKIESPKPTFVSNDDEELRLELLAKAKELGLEPHHKTGVEKLKQMIEEKLSA